MSTFRLMALIFMAQALIQPAWAAEKPLLRVEAGYIAFSFDHNQFFADQAAFDFPPYRVTCRTLKADLTARSFFASGQVTLQGENETLKADVFVFDPAAGSGFLLSYGETVSSRTVGRQEKSPAEGLSRAAEDVSLFRIRQSLLYAVCRAVDISPGFQASGQEVVLFVEGLESVGFKTLRLTVAAVSERRNGPALEKLWFNRTRGLHGRASYFFLNPGKFDSFSQLDYEEHSIIKGYAGLTRQADLQTTNSWFLNPELSLGFSGNYNTSGLLNTQLWLIKDWAGKKISTLWNLTYSRPVRRAAETWLGLKVAVEGGEAGRLAFTGRYEFANQWLGDLIYDNRLWNALNVRIHSAFSKVRLGGTGPLSRIFEGGFNLSYSSRLFNLATDYHLNADLAESQTLSRPQLRVGLNPVPLYGGYLLVSISNVFIYSDLDRKEQSAVSYNNNTALKLSAVPLPLRPGLHLDFSLALEQFLEKEKRNFTSAGLIVNLRQELAAGWTLEGFYALQSRRRTKGGLLEGTTNQDLSAVLRLDPEERISGWVSVSYDPKTGDFKQSFADLSLNIVKGWRFHTLANYDFLLRRLQNIDLYLIREAGRFELRFIWRSLSRQLMVELVPR